MLLTDMGAPDLVDDGRDDEEVVGVLGGVLEDRGRDRRVAGRGVLTQGGSSGQGGEGGIEMIGIQLAQIFDVGDDVGELADNRFLLALIDAEVGEFFEFAEDIMIDLHGASLMAYLLSCVKMLRAQALDIIVKKR